MKALAGNPMRIAVQRAGECMSKGNVSDSTGYRQCKGRKGVHKGIINK